MTTKWQELAQENMEYVEELRERQKKLLQKQNLTQKEIIISRVQLTYDQEGIREEQEKLYYEIKELELFIIEEEYATVPFTKTAQQGVRRFWEAVGGQL